MSSDDKSTELKTIMKIKTKEIAALSHMANMAIEESFTYVRPSLEGHKSSLRHSSNGID